jgi:branched-chain amino acid transport system permease protein
MPEAATAFVDRQQVYFQRFDQRMRARLRKLITPELIAEHAAKPLGQHSDTLERVINYFRRAPIANKYVIRRHGPFTAATFSIMVFPEQPGGPPRPVGTATYATAAAAHHAVFLLRVDDLLAR